MNINCPKCGNPNSLPAACCLYCDRDFSDLPEVVKKIRSETENEELNLRAKNVMVTTADSLEGFRVLETLDVISAECVEGVNLIEDILAGLTDTFGGRSQTAQRILRNARQICLHELRREAAEIGANAVIGIDMNYSQFSGKGKSMLFLVVTGTAVRVERI